MLRSRLDARRSRRQMEARQAFLRQHAGLNETEGTDAGRIWLDVQIKPSVIVEVQFRTPSGSADDVDPGGSKTSARTRQGETSWPILLETSCLSI